MGIQYRLIHYLLSKFNNTLKFNINVIDIVLDVEQDSEVLRIIHENSIYS